MKILLAPSENPDATNAANLLAARLTIAGFEAAIQPWSDDIVPLKDVSDIALVVPMGGDGTFLRAAHLIDFAPIPILGFNYGHIGFLCGNPERDELELITDALAGDLHIERRATLDARITDVAGQTHDITVINELAYTRGMSGHMVEFAYAVNGTRIGSMRADGLVASTATGSTAYALSAGGPIVSPGYGGMVVVPVAPYTINSRALVLAPPDVLEVEMMGRYSYEGSIFVDGMVMDVVDPQFMEVKRGEREVLFVRGGGDFFENVAEAFF